MKFFFGAAIQGSKNREERVSAHRMIIDAIKNNGCSVISEHTTGSNFNETASLFEAALGALPPIGKVRTVHVREKMIELIEGDIDGAIFEVSTPSLGTGIEIAHAYLRPRMGLRGIPIFALYQKNYWPNDLSAMIKGITREKVPHFNLTEYEPKEDMDGIIADLLRPYFDTVSFA